jgi:predicted dehydrogenase
VTQTTKFCLIGAGRVAKVHADSIVNHIPGGELVAIVDKDPKVLEEVANSFNVKHRFSNVQNALDGVEFDAVVITTPTFTHAEIAQLVIGAQKHVFLEKPMALDIAECDDINKAVQENDVKLQLGFMRRFAPEFVEAARRIDAGEIGQPMMIKSLTHGPGLPPPWARDLRTSNGLLAEVNSHDWDCVRWLMGSNLERVYVEVANFKGAGRGVDTENFYDNAMSIIHFENGGIGCISGVCPCDYGYDSRVEIVGEKGIMQIGEMKGEAIVVCTDKDHGLVTPIYRTWPQRFASAYILEMQHFVSCIQNDTQPRVGGEDGRWAVAGVVAGTKSFLETRPVYLSEVLGENK